MEIAHFPFFFLNATLPFTFLHTIQTPHTHHVRQSKERPKHSRRQETSDPQELQACMDARERSATHGRVLDPNRNHGHQAYFFVVEAEQQGATYRRFLSLAGILRRTRTHDKTVAGERMSRIPWRYHCTNWSLSPSP